MIFYEASNNMEGISWKTPTTQKGQHSEDPNTSDIPIQ
jgi:hypothetical protein